ncbi:MAG: hypothetical protein F9K24_20760 [Leptonema illini]|uniref:Uncharacterized protein n=1 Tax=Leptonema illini TaxID=183 RepID=A0A833GXS0_9LEPT|nr:MAG: hypothetical protein F9K24_20760 [Leptonema illini]
MSIEVLITIIIQLAMFAFLFGRQIEAVKGLRERNEKLETRMETLAASMEELAKEHAEHIGEHKGIRSSIA